MPSRVKKPRNEQRRSSGVGNSPASAKGLKTTGLVPIPVTSPVLQAPISSQPIASAVPEIQIPQTQVPVTVLKTTPVKLNHSAIVTVRQEIGYNNNNNNTYNDILIV